VKALLSALLFTAGFALALMALAFIVLAGRLRA
jgi:hypothetical protein